MQDNTNPPLDTQQERPPLQKTSQKPGPDFSFGKKPEQRTVPIEGEPRNKDPRKTTALRYVTTVLFVVLIINLIFALFGDSESLDEITINEFWTQVEAGEIAKLETDDSNRIAKVTYGEETDPEAEFGYNVEYWGSDETEKLRAAGVEYDTEPSKNPNFLTSLLYAMLPILILVGLFYLLFGRKLMGGEGLGGFSANRGKRIEVPETRFADVAGADEAVEELQDLVDLLGQPDKYAAIGAKPPKGFLLVGPPGTGKTLLARALAGEADVPFFSISGSDFVETFVGVGAARVRKLFDSAREVGQAIIFIDEIDAIGRKRTAGMYQGSTEETERTLNQLLVEMDGFDTTNILVLAATNRPDVLDPALTRPGRFDSQITVPAPDRQGRENILSLYASSRPLSTEIDLSSLAKRTPGMTGADLEVLVNSASIIAAQNNRTSINQDDMNEALERHVMGRERRSAILTEEDRSITAWHEAGHTVAAYLLEYADNPVAVSIIPRGQAGGVTWMSGNDKSYLSKRTAIAQLQVAVAGRCAEEVYFKGEDFTSGAANDFAGATDLAKHMVTQFGMSSLGVTNRSLETLDMSDASDVVYTEVEKLLQTALTDARILLKANDAFLAAVAGSLLENETLTYKDVQAIFGATACTA